MLDLADVFQFIINCFNQRPFAQQYFVIDIHERVFHIVSDFSNQMNSINKEHFKQTFGNIAFITKEFAPDFLEEFTRNQGLPVVNVGFSQGKVNHFSLVIDNNMEFESKEPSHTGFSPLGKIGKHLVVMNALVVAHP